jgi:hypothetical protein
VLRIGANSLEIAPDTQFQVADLREKTMQLALRQGRANLDWRRRKSVETAEIDLPRGPVWLLEPGIYDIDAGAPDRPIRITAFTGSARFAGGGGDQTVKAGERLVLTGTDTLSAATETATVNGLGHEFAGHPGPPAGDERPAAVMERCKAPRFVVDPVPAPGTIQTQYPSR